ncbi:hypothetical protein BH11PSE12_BH11PSE12_19950 [soil metagenome]
MSIQMLPNTYQFDVRGVAKRLRHAAIFGALESLEQGDIMRFINDHDPLPLLSQIQQRYDGQVHHTYIQNNPEAVIIDFSIHPKTVEEANVPAEQAKAPATGGCGGGSGGGCGCQGG